MELCAKKYTINTYEISHRIGMLAQKAMLDEVYTTPKPGLVDRYSNGAHKDMNLLTFEKSAQAITPFLIEMAEAGACAAELNDEVFTSIRGIGIKAEEAMLRATNGVNTHKGMIFSLGIFAAATGFCVSHGYRLTESTLFFLEQRLVKERLLAEMKQIEAQEFFRSNGEVLYRKQGITGIRGEAISGYESVRTIALPVLRAGMKAGQTYNLVKLQTLFALMRQVKDTNVVARKGTGALQKLQEISDAFLRCGGAYQADAVEQLIRMDSAFIAENISAGGCADLLAVAIFIYDIMEGFGV